MFTSVEVKQFFQENSSENQPLWINSVLPTKPKQLGWNFVFLFSIMRTKKSSNSFLKIPVNRSVQLTISCNFCNINRELLSRWQRYEQNKKPFTHYLRQHGSHLKSIHSTAAILGYYGVLPDVGWWPGSCKQSESRPPWNRSLSWRRLQLWNRPHRWC